MRSIRVMIVAVATALALLALGGTGNAATGTFKDGPYTAATADSGTCGNNWALDLFTRHFEVALPGPGGGTFQVTEDFTKGHFSTFAGVSPGACNTGTNNGNMVTEGVAGTFKGTEGITVSGGTFNANGACELTQEDGYQQCNTAGWIAAFFGDSATFSVGTFHFAYKASGQGTVAGNWVNADTGNTGDIATSFGV